MSCKHKLAHDAVGPLVKKMQHKMEEKEIARVSSRNSIETAITCRPYLSTGAICASDGIMRNFSIQGAYIETSHNYQFGTILIMQIMCYPRMGECMGDGDWPPSICLAEVKWRQELIDENSVRYGMGLRYLD
jgi:hypothetical protein